MDLKDYEVKNTDICACGHKFDIHEIDGFKSIDVHNFYSNAVKTCSLIKCPRCKTETALLLKQKGQTWEILGIAVKEQKELPKKKIQFQAKPNVVAKKVEKPQIKPTEMQNKAEKEKSQEFICPKCQKVCKSKMGLMAHMRSHK